MTWNKPEVFVIRAPASGRYAWQIRKFGGVVVETSVTEFGSRTAAQAAGEEVLAGGP